MKPGFEVRILEGCELRSDGARRIKGYAAVFNQLSEDLGGFREVLRQGCFKDCLDAGADVRCLFNHDSGCVLGRRSARTLRLSEDATGLKFACDLPDTQVARDLLESIQRGDISQCSFGFRVNKDKWTDSGTRREVHKADVLEVSPVAFPAYPQTVVNARALASTLETVGLYRMNAVHAHEEVERPRPLDPQLERERMRTRLRLSTMD
jgi:uncharacterized protein